VDQKPKTVEGSPWKLIDERTVCRESDNDVFPEIDWHDGSAKINSAVLIDSLKRPSCGIASLSESSLRKQPDFAKQSPGSLRNASLGYMIENTAIRNFHARPRGMLSM